MSDDFANVVQARANRYVLERVEVPSDNRERRLASMRSGVKGAARLIEEELMAAGVRYRTAMITFTYRPGEFWERGDIGGCIDCYRKWAERHGHWMHYVWVLELTKAGRPHYHLVLFVPRGVTPPLPDKQGWWKKGCTNAKWCHSPVGYIAKYASKGLSGEIPKHARLWGCSFTGPAMRAKLRWFLAPSWVRKLVPFDEGVKRVRQWWCNAVTGWSYLTPWVLDSVRAGFIILRKLPWSLDAIHIPSFPGEPPPMLA